VLDSKDLCSRHNIGILEQPSSWQRLISKLSESASIRESSRIILICGPLRSGKSTFCRFLVNKLITSGSKSSRVAILDLDSDRPEMSLPGHIGLFLIQEPILQPPFAGISQNSASLLRSHFVGSPNSHDNLHLVSAARDLLHWTSSADIDSHSGSILIVHCPGWYQGCGNEKVANLITSLQASEIVLLSDPPHQVLEAIERRKPLLQCHTLPVNDFKTFHIQRNRSQINEMTTQAYFHRHRRNPRMLEYTPISSWRPLAVSFQDMRRDFSAILIAGQLPPMYPNMLFRLLNGNLVSVVLADPDLDLPNIALGEGDGIPYFEPSSGAHSILFNSEKPRAVGLALIRSIDLDKKIFLVLCPSTISNLPADRLILICGGMPFPDWAYVEDHEYRNYARCSRDPNAQLYLANESEGHPYTDTRNEEA
jgi:polynucleotide 5'-hydroxyl-kinase GRC3/NOL9